ncbi:MAG: hypothetical protein NUV52_03400 [Candidatus Roizmanbacteria bacterium]|nr:hypothetical protein [Candidatus Roizmanbacteria bacterium]
MPEGMHELETTVQKSPNLRDLVTAEQEYRDSLQKAESPFVTNRDFDYVAAELPFGPFPYTEEWDKRKRQLEQEKDPATILTIEYPYSTPLQQALGDRELQEMIKKRNELLFARAALVPTRLAVQQHAADELGVTWPEYVWWVNTNTLPAPGLISVDREKDMYPKILNATCGRILPEWFTLWRDVEAHRILPLFSDHHTPIEEARLLNELDKNPTKVTSGWRVRQNEVLSPEERLRHLAFSGLLEMDSKRVGRFQYRLRTLPEIGELTYLSALGNPHGNAQESSCMKDYLDMRRASHDLPTHIQTAQKLISQPGGGQYLLDNVRYLGPGRLRALDRLIQHFTTHIKGQ